MTVTNDFTITRDLIASLNRQDGVPFGLTWGSIKAAMTVLGVKDDDRIASIEIGVMQAGGGRMVREDAVDGIEVREVRMR